ncbi:MAG: hypothetical protein M9957_07020, partial [Rhodobacteraceae bacterium]|nr:hypothetical protein [Paracoccaceae bacterium]
LVEVYKFRDAVAAARSPFIWASEMRSEPEDSGSSLQTSKESHEGLVRAHQRRLNEFGVIRPQLYALLLEAEAVWGADLSKLWRGLDRLQGELISQTQLYLEFSDPENSSAPETAYYASKEARAAGEKIVYSNGEAEGQNDFSNRFLAAFSRVEDYLRAKLGRSVK